MEESHIISIIEANLMPVTVQVQPYSPWLHCQLLISLYAILFNRVALVMFQLEPDILI